MKLLPYINELIIEAGVDEAGRGCLAGPVYAAAVILPKDFDDDILNDSKLLSEKKRYALREMIQERALAWGVGIATEEEIDIHNISNAAYIAMHRAVQLLKITPEMLLIDGKFFKSQTSTPHTCIIKGDSKIASIAAASILAKTYRDDYMKQLAPQYPHYNWEINKGYPTGKHREAILNHGVSPHHRKSFRLLTEGILIK
jgi:ribonuclease HII